MAKKDEVYERRSAKGNWNVVKFAILRVGDVIRLKRTPKNLFEIIKAPGTESTLECIDYKEEEA